jgi:hypothetical protein
MTIDDFHITSDNREATDMQLCEKFRVICKLYIITCYQLLLLHSILGYSTQFTSSQLVSVIATGLGYENLHKVCEMSVSLGVLPSVSALYVRNYRF